MSKEALEEALQKVVTAWEELPEGNHSPYAIGVWLADDMKPAINEARQVLGRQVPTPDYP
jgi:hypothetical protein